MAEYICEMDEQMHATVYENMPIVRCRYCRRAFEERGELWCRGIVGPPVDPDGFCAWGERRGDGGRDYI